jgi:alpha-tubulin suppressor-like RCC1 family protein
VPAATALALGLAAPVQAAAPPTGDAGVSFATASGSSVAGSVSAGLYHSCAVRTNGTLACWGDNRSGRSTVPTGFG